MLLISSANFVLRSKSMNVTEYILMFKVKD